MQTEQGWARHCLTVSHRDTYLLQLIPMVKGYGREEAKERTGVKKEKIQEKKEVLI